MSSSTQVQHLTNFGSEHKKHKLRLLPAFPLHLYIVLLIYTISYLKPLHLENFSPLSKPPPPTPTAFSTLGYVTSSFVFIVVCLFLERWSLHTVVSSFDTHEMLPTFDLHSNSGFYQRWVCIACTAFVLLCPVFFSYTCQFGYIDPVILWYFLQRALVRLHHLSPSISLQKKCCSKENLSYPSTSRCLCPCSKSAASCKDQITFWNGCCSF